jgi:hypothetical protein
MLYKVIIAVCSKIYTKHLNTLCGQNVEFVSVKPGGKYKYVLWRVRTYSLVVHLVMDIQVLLDVTLCLLEGIYRRFGES